MNCERFHLVLTTDSGPIMHGWWASKATAQRKFKVWVGEHGNMRQHADGARHPH
ncbi:hypothetical protein [Streptomyces sp. NPDC091215]|uniref:hypothetical protein n=1 Tax=Streptomyces sp. NPDC091215 TaxID=3155192 RepID=UPI003444C05E